MLFRNSLLNPSLYITERYNHAERYVNFYSPYLYWDDASVYQRSKRLKIKNTSDVPVYFKKKIIWKKIYLVTIIPKKVDDFVYVKKEQTSHLTATVWATVFDKNGEKKSEQFWNSKYIKRNYSN
jgi:vancomycin resistance protein YoaR